MRSLRPVLICHMLLAGVWLAPGASPPHLYAFSNAVWVARPGNDGDSFAVACGDRMMRVRLYAVDAPELTTRGEGMAARVETQRRYFGLARNDQVMAFGRQAAELSAALLASPFTVHTAFQDARGEGERIYAFIRLSDGRDLGTLLVAAGLARAYGMGRTTPEGLSARESRARLVRTETVARNLRCGAWGGAGDAAAPKTATGRYETGRMPECPSLFPVYSPLVLLVVIVAVLLVWAAPWG